MCLFSFMIVFRNRGVCANEPSLAVTLREESQVELLGRRLTDLARAQLCPPGANSVNTIFRKSRRLSEPPLQVPETQSAFHLHAQRNAFRRRPKQSFGLGH